MKRPPILSQRRLVRYGLQGIALGGVATAIVLGFTLRGESITHLRSLSPLWLLALFAMVATAWVCNGARMAVMCRAMGHRLSARQALAVSMSTEFGITATPAGVGGTVIRLALLRQAGVPYVTSGSLLAADVSVDIVFFALLTPFAVYLLLRDGLLQALFNQPSEMHAVIALSLVAALATAAIMLLRTDRFHRALSRLLGATAWGRRRRLAARHRHLRAATGRSMRRIGSSLAYLWRERKGALLLNLLIASVQWCCRYMVLPVILFALHAPVNPLPLFLVQGVLFGLSLVVVAPGGGGSIELLGAVILPNFVSAGLVGVVVVVWRIFTYHLYLIGGGVMFFYTSRHLHALFPRGGDAPAVLDPVPSHKPEGTPPST